MQTKEVTALNRFAFLKTDYEDLYKLCTEAQENCNMNKARQVIEIIVRQFGATKRHLFDRIGEVSEREGMPKDVISAFHQVRLVGNKASHDETLAWNKITNEDIDKCLEALFEIVVWLAIGHDKKVYRSDDFNIEDLKIVDKYLNEDIKTKREKIKELGTFINSLDISTDALDFDNSVEDELTRDVFETSEEYIQRINELPPQHIGYAILDNRTRDSYTGLTFAMFHIEKEDKIIFSDISAFTAKMDNSYEDFIDGKIVVGLKVSDGKVYCDYDRVYLQSQKGNRIKMTAICWTKHHYEGDNDFEERLKSLPILPLGIAKPIRKEYDLENQCLSFKVALYKYVKLILDFDMIFANESRDLAKEFCDYKDYFKLYGDVNNRIMSLRHINYDKDIKTFLRIVDE